MASLISPGVSVSEVDLTTTVPSVATTAGAFVGPFVWGPAYERIQLTNETDLVNNFGEPDSNTFVSFFTAASFLAYGNNLTVVRSLGANAHNAIANTSNAFPPQIPNPVSFENTLLNTNNNNVYGPFMARYCGAKGNSLTVSIIDAGAGAGGFSSWNVNGVGVSSLFQSAPNTSVAVSAAGGSNDEIHIVVVDTGGVITGVKNTVLETYAFLSKAADSVDVNGNSNYYKNVLWNQSNYIYGVDPAQYSSTVSTWGLPMANTQYATLSGVVTDALGGGADDTGVDANVESGWNLFQNPDTSAISLVLTGGASVAVQQYVIDNVVTTRKDCMAFISPPSSAVINQIGQEVTNITTWYTSLSRSSSYVVADSGWKYMFDKYNNVYRYIPLNGDIAGLCVYTDSVANPWWSPAGFNRGNLKNVIKLAWSPNQVSRDDLYSLGINPVVSFPGQGTVLFGDKTLLNKPSAFDRINVRRLFIILEQSISQAAQFSLFEFNDEFTRANFVALVTPFLRNVQGLRGISDFLVVCDTTNNTPAVIDNNQFVGDIYIKFARSINYIQLNFVAVATGVSFTTVVGQA
jgi:hypothetical protein